jgi:hypothetical protein
MMNSGGSAFQLPSQDPARVPATITAHGPGGFDVVIIDFEAASLDYDRDVVARGGFAVDCNHGGGHCAAPPELIKAQWEFANAHPYGVDPKPYTGGLPGSFPSYCQIIRN